MQAAVSGGNQAGCCLLATRMDPSNLNRHRNVIEHHFQIAKVAIKK